VIKARGLVWLEEEFSKEISTTGEMKVEEAVVNKDSGVIGTMAGVGHGPLIVGIPSFKAGGCQATLKQRISALRIIDIYHFDSST
jgi:hypothetical protein